jgi:hypothetical protein
MSFFFFFLSYGNLYFRNKDELPVLKIADFGLAKGFESESQVLTATFIVGTPLNMVYI